MKLGFRDSIGVRFLRIVFGCYLIVTLIVTSTQLYIEYTEFEHDVVVELANVGRSFEDGLAKALWNIDNESIQSIITGIQKIEAIDGVKVVDLQDNIQAASGIHLNDKSKFKQVGITTADNTQAKVIALEGIHAGNYYEYSLGIIFEETPKSRPELIGFLSLYTSHSLVIKKFRHSFFLIVSIACIKTIALWLIFLYFARGIVAKPLTELTNATQTLSQSDQTLTPPANFSRLEDIANSRKRDEIQMLASGFIHMHRSIVEKLHNLYALNDFAIRLSKLSSTIDVFEHTTELMNSMFGCQLCILFDKKQKVVWSSLPKEDFEDLKLSELAHDKSQFKMHFFDRNVTYTLDGAILLNGKEGENNLPVLTLPLMATGYEGKQLRFFGPLHKERLTEELQLTKETKSFLQVVAIILGNSLTNLQQREVIEEQNLRLEQRVEERTKELEDVNAELKHLAVHDPLTQLPNRTLFNDRLEQLINVAYRENRKFAVASIDLTKFKMINDNYGHDVGDLVLVEVSRRFGRALRSTDTLARMGGDEFAAILRDIDNEQALNTVVSQIISSLNEPIILKDETNIVASANIGIALFPQHAQESDQLFKMADIAMYHAKRDHSGFSVFDINKTSKEKEISKLISELELAIIREELTLYYQPIVDIRTKTIVAFEALIRWEHPEQGLIPPNQFIPHAERSRHINPLTLWVLKTACQQSISLKKAGLQRPISVNISPRAFASPDLPSDIKSLLDTYDLPPQWIKLEITESTAMSNPTQALEILEKFKQMGSPISIDDFGTGHSSLAYLTQLPLDELKIDKSFLTDDTESNRVIVETIIELAHALDLKVVAEGIESEATRNMLIEKGCDYAQGFYFGFPLEAKHLIPLLKGEISPETRISSG